MTGEMAQVVDPNKRKDWSSNSCTAKKREKKKFKNKTKHKD
jgi:hypothetical protein